MWHNQILERGPVDPRAVKPHPMNHRRHGDTQRTLVGALIRQYGWVDEVLVNKRTMHILNGHLRVQKAIDDNEPTIPVRWVDLSEDDERLVLFTFDGVGLMAAVDRDAQAKLLDSAASDDAMIAAFLDGEREVLGKRERPPERQQTPPQSPPPAPDSPPEAPQAQSGERPESRPPERQPQPDEPTLIAVRIGKVVVFVEWQKFAAWFRALAEQFPGDLALAKELQRRLEL